MGRERVKGEKNVRPATGGQARRRRVNIAHPTPNGERGMGMRFERAQWGRLQPCGGGGEAVGCLDGWYRGAPGGGW